MRQMAAATTMKDSSRVPVDSALSLQIWRASGLYPKTLHCPRQVFSAEVAEEPSTSAPVADSLFFRVPQPPASQQFFYNGPVDTLPNYGEGGWRRASRTAAPPPPAVLPYAAKQPRGKPAQAARAQAHQVQVAASSAAAWAETQVEEETDPLGSLLSQCARRSRTGRRRPRVDIACSAGLLFGKTLERPKPAQGKGCRTASEVGGPQRQASQQQLQCMGGPDIVHASSGGSMSSGSAGGSVWSQAMDAKGRPLSPSSPLSEWGS